MVWVLFARDAVLWSDPIVRRNCEKIDPSDYVLPACRAKVDGAGDLVDGHASGPEKPGQVPGVDTGEDVPHPRAEGNTGPESSENSLASRSTASAPVDSGTRCSRPVFIRSGGMRHSRA